MTQGASKQSALQWLMDTYGYKYSKELNDMSRAVQGYADYCQQFDHDVARRALNDVLKELCEITGMSRDVGYVIQLRHLKKLMKREVTQ